MPDHHAYRRAQVDPKTLFAPGRTDWTPQEQITAYGTADTLSSSNATIRQEDYAAIVLVNPNPDSEPLKLTATVFKQEPTRSSKENTER